MLEIGRKNTLKVECIDEEGAWLVAGAERALLPKREVPESLVPGDKVTVFVYNDHAGEPVATLREPLAEVGECALMKVRQVNSYGAFLDWGLFKELLVPPREQPEPMKPGRRYVVKVRLDRQGRPLGTARIEQSLVNVDVDLQEGQEVDLLVWRFTPLGARVVINQRYDGLLYRDEIGNRLNYGDRLTGYVKKVRGDGKIDVTLNRGGRGEIDQARDRILAAIEAGGGFLPLHDGSSPDEIGAALGMSKKLFKKALGGLYKAGAVELLDRGVRLKGKR
jgi:predicted RNA-binding protein (virulence factor B family)